MNPLLLPATDLTPSVVFRPDAGSLAFEGNCYPENPALFFRPIFSAVERMFRESSVDGLEVTFHLSYVNSASTKALRRLLGLLNAMGEHGTVVQVAWIHDPDDDTMAELGRDLVEDLRFLTYRGGPEAAPAAAVGT